MTNPPKNFRQYILEVLKKDMLKNGNFEKWKFGNMEIRKNGNFEKGNKTQFLSDQPW